MNTKLTQWQEIKGCFCNWKAVSSEALRVSVLGPLMNRALGILEVFAKTTKIGCILDREDSCRLQEDISGLVKWAEKWQMEFNSKKCSDAF